MPYILTDWCLTPYRQYSSHSTVEEIFYLVAVPANSEVITGFCTFSRRKTYPLPYTAWSFDDDKSCSIVFSLGRRGEKVSTALQKIMKLIFPFKLGPSFSEKSSNLKTLRRVLPVAVPFKITITLKCQRNTNYINNFSSEK